ncbi:MAG TPA: hypothetical protein VHZ24_18530 [Pirellulales bacterium]|jgi:hypothetical protein|nr:hypothetical protein [Pirellulales bacterium]
MNHTGVPTGPATTAFQVRHIVSSKKLFDRLWFSAELTGATLVRATGRARRVEALRSIPRLCIRPSELKGVDCDDAHRFSCGEQARASGGPVEAAHGTATSRSAAWHSGDCGDSTRGTGVGEAKRLCGLSSGETDLCAIGRHCIVPAKMDRGAEGVYASDGRCLSQGGNRSAPSASGGYAADAAQTGTRAAENALTCFRSALDGMINGLSAERTAENDRPNLLLFGVGHSGTTIVAKMLSKLGWQLGDADGFGENVAVRRMNARTLNGKPLVPNEAQRLLAQLNQPWLIKDPRFVLTVNHWLPVFNAMPANARPAMLFITREIEKVERTYIAYGEVKDCVPFMYRHTVRELYDASWQGYRAWPFQKIHLEFEQVIDAVKMFNVVRASRRDAPITE